MFIYLNSIANGNVKYHVNLYEISLQLFNAKEEIQITINFQLQLKLFSLALTFSMLVQWNLALCIPMKEAMNLSLRINVKYINFLRFEKLNSFIKLI